MADVLVPVGKAAGAGMGAEQTAHLKHGTLSLFDSVMIATASVAPAYSLAATMGLMVIAVGVQAPAAIIASFVPVFFIALAYFFLNRQDPNCGASYTWISRTLNPHIGWFTGWVQTAASVLFCTAAPLLAGANTLSFFNSVGWISTNAASDTRLIAAVGFLWLLLVTAMVVRGIRLTANFQWIMVGIEYLLVLGFSIAAFIKIAAQHPAGSQNISVSWFNPFQLAGLDGLAAGAVLGVFFFWGWDTAANLNEETENAKTTPGNAGLISMVILLVLFMIACSAMQALVPADTLSKQGATALTYFAGQVFPAPWSYAILIAVLASTVATTQTTLLPATRLTLSMSRDAVFPPVFGLIHRVWQTPYVGTIIVAGISAIGVWLTAFNGNINSTMTNVVNNIGVLVCFYYGVTGIACAWAFRKALFKSPRILVLAGILPLLGGLALFWVGYEVVKLAGIGPSLPVTIPMVLGLPLLVLTIVLTKSQFFSQKTVSYDIGPNGEIVSSDATTEPSVAV
jgi:amino acid transporter